MDIDRMEPAAASTLGPWDYVVLALTLMISTAIGLYYRFSGGRQKTTQEYLLGDHSLSAGPVAFSLMASFMSAVTLLGVSAENYVYGAQFVVINIGYGVVTPVAAYLFLPVFFKLQAASAYQYLELRFGVAARLSASLAYTVQIVLYMGIALYAPSLAVRAVTGLDENAAVLVVGIVCTFYAGLGGMKAVVATDVFQSFLMLAAVILVVVKGSIDVGGLDRVWEIAVDGGRVFFDSTSPDPTVRHTWWSLMIGGGFTYLTLYAVSQGQVQRLVSCKDLATAQRALWWSWPILSILSVTTSLAGLAMFSRYYACDPLATGRIEKLDQLMPLYVVESMGNYPGLPGLFVAGLACGSLSSVSAAVNSMSAVTLEDYLKPLYRRCRGQELPEKRAPFLSKLLAFGYGLVFLAVAFLAQLLGGVLQASLTIFGAVGGPLLGMFTLGMFMPFTNQPGAISGLLSGLAFSMWIAFGEPRPVPPKLPSRTDGCSALNTTVSSLLATSTTTEIPPIQADSQFFYLYRLSYLWTVVFGFLVTVAVGVLVSLLATAVSNDETPPPDPDLFSPPIRRYLLKKRSNQHGTTFQVKKLEQENIVLEEPLNGTNHVTPL